MQTDSGNRQRINSLYKWNDRNLNVSIDQSQNLTVDIHSQEALRYGDSVYLVSSVSANGTLDLITSFISSESCSIVTTKKYSYDSETENPIMNIDMCIFQILPPNKYQIQNDYEDFSNKSNDDNSMSPEDESLRFRLKRDLKREIEENLKEQDRLYMRDVFYGDIFQLKHKYSGCYIGVSDMKTSVVDRSSLKVDLFNNNGQHVQFRINPKYKVRNVGDKIRIEDQIVLENIKSQQYLHVSSAQIGDCLFGMESKDKEVNASPIDTEFTIYSAIKNDIYFNYASEIRGGSVIRLYHLEHQCYIVASGSCGFDDDRVLLDNVHFRKKKTKLVKVKEPSTSSICFWQLEHVVSPLSGDVVRWGDHCRIKHLLTQLYLAIDQQGINCKLTLIPISKCTDNASISFVFKPFIDEGRPDIDNHSYARLYHPGSNTWIRSSYSIYHSSTSQLDDSRILIWDNAETYEINAETIRGYHDAFTIEKVETDLLLLFNYSFGFLPIIRNHLINYGNDIKQFSTYINGALKELSSWIHLTDDAKQIKIKQKLLRNLGIIELLMETQNRFSSVDTHSMNVPSYEYLSRTASYIYSVIAAFLHGNSRKNENYCVKYIRTLEKHFNFKIGAEQTLIELVENNQVIINHLSDEFGTHVVTLFTKLFEEKNYYLFIYFGVMCVSEDYPIQKNQVILAEQLMSENGSIALYKFKLNPSKQVLTLSPFDYIGWSLVSAYFEKLECESKRFLYLKYQLEFFTKICKGNNVISITILEKMISFEIIFSALIDSEIHPIIRSQFSLLLSVMFIDVGLNRPVLEDITLTFIYSSCTSNPGQIEANDDSTSLSGAHNKYFPILKPWFYNFLEDCSIYGHEDYMYDNYFISSVIDVILLFVKFGYYDNYDDINRMLNAIIRLANGDKDNYHLKLDNVNLAHSPATYYKATGRYENTTANQSNFMIKLRAIRIIDLFINFRFFKRLQRIIFYYRLVAHDDKILKRKKISIVDNQAGPEDILSKSIHKLHTSDYDVFEHEDVVNNMKILIEEVMKYGLYEFEDRNLVPSLESILLDLSRYDFSHLATSALRLLNSMYSVEENLLKEARETILLINPSSVDLYHTVVKLLPNFRRLILAPLFSVETCCDLLDIINLFIQSCSRISNSEEANSQNQNILYNFGILDNLIYLLSRSHQESNILASSEQSDSIDQGAYIKIAKASIKLLSKLAQSNPQVQQILYDRFESIVTKRLFNLAPIETGSLITTIFLDAPDLAQNIKYEYIDRIIHLLKTQNKIDMSLIPPVTESLRTLTKIHHLDLPLHMNQVHIMNSLVSIIRESMDAFIGKEKLKEETRMRLLSLDLQNSNTEEIASLHSMLSLYNLFASLCEGQHPHHESVCKSMISLEEILLILNSNQFDLNRKTPFASFFNKVYLNSSGSIAVIETFLLNCEEFWHLLRNSIKFCEMFNKNLVTSSQKKLSVFSILIKQSYDTRLLEEDIDNNSASDFEFNSGILAYLLHGLLPIINTIYSRYFITDESTHIESNSLFASTSMKLYNQLMIMSINMQPLLSNSNQAKLLYNTTLSIICHKKIYPLRYETFLEFSNKATYARFNEIILGENSFISKTEKNYQEFYKAEIELNNRFHLFAMHLRKAYLGKNTIIDQIGLKIDGNYTFFLDNSCFNEAPDSIPLGKSFQNHLKLFFNFKDGFYTVNCYTKGLLKQLLHSFQNSNLFDEKERLIQESLDVKCIQILRAAIHNQILSVVFNTNKTSPNDYLILLKKVEHLQNNIQELYNASISFLILIGHSSQRISDQAISFLKDLLYGGNTNVQKSIESLAETREEKYFEQMDNILCNGENSLIEERQINSTLELSSVKNEQMRILFSKLLDQMGADEDNVGANSYSNEYNTDLPIFRIPQFSLTKHINIRRVLDDRNMALNLSSVENQSKNPDNTSQVNIRLSKLKSEHMKNSGTKIGNNSLNHNTITPQLRRIKLSFTIMGLMCDKQQKFLQEYFREQSDNPENINMIVKSIKYLRVLQLDINDSTIHLVTEVFKTLIEFVSGNFKNQTEAFVNKIFDTVNRIFLMLSFRNCFIEKVIDLYSSIIKFLQVMTEETSPETKYLAKDIYEVLDISCHHIIIGVLFRLKKDQLLSPMYQGKANDSMFMLYHFLIHLKDFNTVEFIDKQINISLIHINPSENDESLVFQAWQYCANKSRSIEVIYINESDDQILNRLHFESQEADELTKDIREIVKWGVNRDSIEDKLRDFLDWFVEVRKDRFYLNKLYTTPIIKHYLKYTKVRKYLFFIWSLLCNFFILITWKTPCQSVSSMIINSTLIFECNGNYSDTEIYLEPIRPNWYMYAFYPLSGIHLLLSLDLLCIFYLINFANFYVPTFLKLLLPFTISKSSKRIMWKKRGKILQKSYSTNKLNINLFGVQVLFYWIIFFSSIFSIVTHGYFWPVSLLYILDRSDTLQRILKAVTKNGKSLMLVLLFGGIVIYLFSVIGFALFFLQAQSTIDAGSEHYLFCHTLYECFVSFARYGLLETIGLRLPQRTMNFWYELPRIVYDIMFFIVISIIGLNIVFGIIVDTFSELRDEKSNKQKDMKSICFICGIENYLFDRKGNGFKHHIKNEQNMWDYYDFFLYLDGIDPSEHSATENYVYHKLKERDTTFFPINRARCFQSESDNTAFKVANLKEVIDDTNSSLKELLARVKNLESKL